MKIFSSNNQIKKSVTTKNVFHSEKSMSEITADLKELERKTDGGFKLLYSGNMSELSMMSEEELKQFDPFFRQHILEWKNKRKAMILGE